MEQRRTTVHAQLPRFAGSSCMSSKEIFYVVRAQMRPLEVADSYAEDYYFHKYFARRPLPVSSKDKEDLRAREEHIRRDQRLITVKWEEGHRVLGHVAKADVVKPRELISGNESAVDTFDSPLWIARRIVDAGVQLLLQLEETRAAAQLDRERERELLQKLTEVVCGPAAADGDSLRGEGRVDALFALPKGVKLLNKFVHLLPDEAAHSTIIQCALYHQQQLDLDPILNDATPLVALLPKPTQPVTNRELSLKVSQIAAAKNPINTPKQDLALYHARKHLYC